MKIHKFVVIFIFILILGWAKGQIIGGSEEAEFKPGDITLFADDFSSIPLGEPSKNFKLMRGTYEIAQFQEKKWIRPLDKNLGLTKTLHFPNEFSFEFVFYAFKEGHPWARIYLHTAKGISEWGLEGGERYIEIEVGREHNGDYIILRASGNENPTYYPQQVAFQQLKGEQPHHVSIQVRREQLRLFVDGKRVAIIPFQPKTPIEGIGLYWYHTYQTDVPYRDSPVLLTNFRIASYSNKESLLSNDNSIQLLLIINESKIDKTKLKEKNSLEEILHKIGSKKTDRGWLILLPSDPFETGSWQVKIDQSLANQWIKQLKEILKTAKQLQSESYLLIEGFAPEIKSQERSTEFWGQQLEFWLSSLRAKSFSLWLVQQGFSIKDLKTNP